MRYFNNIKPFLLGAFFTGLAALAIGCAKDSKPESIRKPESISYTSKDIAKKIKESNGLNSTIEAVIEKNGTRYDFYVPSDTSCLTPNPLDLKNIDRVSYVDKGELGPSPEDILITRIAFSCEGERCRVDLWDHELDGKIDNYGSGEVENPDEIVKHLDYNKIRKHIAQKLESVTNTVDIASKIYLLGKKGIAETKPRRESRISKKGEIEYFDDGIEICFYIDHKENDDSSSITTYLNRVSVIDRGRPRLSKEDELEIYFKDGSYENCESAHRDYGFRNFISSSSMGTTAGYKGKLKDLPFDYELVKNYIREKINQKLSENKS